MTTTIVSSGLTSTGLTVSAGDVVEVLSGGTLETTSVDSGGVLTLLTGVKGRRFNRTGKSMKVANSAAAAHQFG